MGEITDLIPGVGTAVSAIGDIFGIFSGMHQNHLANKIKPVYKPYETSQYSKQQMGLAQQLFNGMMPGYTQQQQHIANSQANYTGNIDRNATDGAQALALQGLSQGASNNAYGNLGQQQQQYQSAMLNNLNDAYKTMTEEGDKSYQSMLQKYMMDSQTQNGLRGAGAQNIVGGFNDFGSKAIAYGNYQKSGK
jgi:hypothetical protein